MTDSGATTGSQATASFDSTKAAGVTIAGRYQLIEKIGEGGMGLVWIAQQSEPVKRLVAIKLIKSGMDSKAVLARFEAERQALAIMDHPNIAKVLDGGLTDDHRPYFVMELVKGTPITKFCDERKLSPRQRLELFVPVCQAIQHAHQKGIIHRDIKPSNVLVATYDDRPVPKVIDFGVAKAAGSQLTELTLNTGIGALVGTPEYMSPEQASLNNLDIDTRSDVYSLGVLLYELLTGATPVDRKRLGEAALMEVLRIVREVEAPRPSTKLSSSDALPSIAANRHMEPAQLSALVKGELDWIVMKSLEKDRSRRYETANGFAADVLRYLSGEAVMAVPPSTAYRLQKFVMRNKGKVVAASLVLAALLLGMAGTTWGLIKASQAADAERQAKEREAERAEGERQARLLTEKERDAKAIALAAETKAREAEQQARGQAMSALRTLTDEVVDLQIARGTTLTEDSREFLRKIIKQYEGFAAVTGDALESKAIRVEGNYRVGLMRHRLGELKEAEVAYRDALAAYQQISIDAPARPEFQKGLGACYLSLGLLLRTTGRLKEAETSYEKALAIYMKLVADNPTDLSFQNTLGKVLNNLGFLHYYTGRMKEAEVIYGEALSIRKQLAEKYSGESEYQKNLAASYNNLAALLSQTSRVKDAEAAYKIALGIQKQLVANFPTLPELRKELAQSHTNLVSLFKTTGRLKQAENECHEALAIQKQLADDFPTRPDFQWGLAAGLQELASLLRDSGQAKAAIDTYHEAQAIQKKLVVAFPARPDFRQGLANGYIALGILFLDTGRLKEAEGAFNEALLLAKQLAAYSSVQPSYRYDLANCYSNLARIFSITDRPKEAESAYGSALAILIKLADDFPNNLGYQDDLAGAYNNQGLLFCDTNRPKDGEASFNRALAIRRKLATTHPDLPVARNSLAGTLVNLAGICADRRDLQTAKAYLEEAQPHHKAALQAIPSSPSFRIFYRNNLLLLTRVHAGGHDQQKAIETAQKIHDLGWKPDEDAYTAACALALCIPIVRQDEQLKAEERDKLALFYGDESMKLLRDAVNKGWKDAVRTRIYRELAPINNRSDFKKLVESLNEKN